MLRRLGREATQLFDESVIRLEKTLEFQAFRQRQGLLHLSSVDRQGEPANILFDAESFRKCAVCRPQIGEVANHLEAFFEKRCQLASMRCAPEERKCRWGRQ